MPTMHFLYWKITVVDLPRGMGEHSWQDYSAIQYPQTDLMQFQYRMIQNGYALHTLDIGISHLDSGTLLLQPSRQLYSPLGKRIPFHVFPDKLPSLSILRKHPDGVLPHTSHNPAFSLLSFFETKHSPPSLHYMNDICRILIFIAL